MKRRNLLKGLTALATLPLLPACTRAAATSPGNVAIAPLSTPAVAWRDKVSAAAFAVLFQEETERPFSSALEHEKRTGTFVCAACHLPLFDSIHKFDSGTGWPSFVKPITGHVETKKDFALILARIEYHCVRCGGHQGHVFNDGPPPRGQRWCNNGLALAFVPKGEPLPDLRS